MSHENEQHIEENPKSVTSTAFYFVLLVGALALGIITFQRSLSHAEEGHATEAPVNKGEKWDESASVEYSTSELTGKKPEEVKPVETVVVTSNEEAAPQDNAENTEEKENTK